MKKNILILSFYAVIIFAVALFISVKGYCLFALVCNRPHDDSLSLILFPLIPLFIFSLITYPMKESIFQAWWKFSRVWVPLSILVVLISPSNSHNWLFPIEKGGVAFFSSAIFIFVSFGIITWKSISSRKKK